MKKSLFLILLSLSSLCGKETVHIALIYDGPAVKEGPFSKQVQIEVTDLLDEEYDALFYDVVGGWNLPSASRNVWGALHDPKIDLIITMGMMSSFEMLKIVGIDKPVVIGNNLSYFTEEDRKYPALENPFVAFYYSTFFLPNEIETFASIIEAKNLAFIGDASLISDVGFPVIHEKIMEAAEIAGIVPLFFPVVDQEKVAIQALNDVKVDGVVFLPTWRLPEENFNKLIEEINSYYLPSFSLLGENEVSVGVLMTMTPSKEVIRSARRIALDAQELLISGRNNEIVTKFTRSHELIINEKTAETIRIDLPWKVEREAIFIDRVSPDPADILTFNGAAHLAVQNNLDLLAETYAVEGGYQDVLRRFSRLMPQVNSRLEGRIIDTNSAKAAFGFQPEKKIRGGIAIDQMLYDERKVSEFSIERKLQKAREYNRKSLELDIILDTAVAYLLILRSKADIKIAEENINLSKANLRRAHELVDSGQARLSEVYRWESELASNQDALVSLEADLENLETEFNRLLNRPLKTPVILEDIHPFDQQIILDYGNLAPYLNTPIKFSRFKDFMIHLARENSPDIDRISEEVKAEKRRWVATKRSFYLPEFSAFGELANNLYRGGAGNSPPPGVSSGKLESRIGVSLTYPLFTSGRRSSEKNKSFFEIQRLKTDKNSLIERIDESVIQSIDNMKASFESIFLAKRAAEAGEKNLVIVTNSYTRGVVSIVDLLDAQNQMIVSKQTYANALYDYLIDYMDFQRATSQYDFLMPIEEKESFKEKLIQALKDP